MFKYMYKYVYDYVHSYVYVFVYVYVHRSWNRNQSRNLDEKKCQNRDRLQIFQFRNVVKSSVSDPHSFTQIRIWLRIQPKISIRIRIPDP